MHSTLGKEWRGMKASGQNFKKTSNFIKMETEGGKVTSYVIHGRFWAAGRGTFLMFGV